MVRCTGFLVTCFVRLLVVSYIGTSTGVCNVCTQDMFIISIAVTCNIFHTKPDIAAFGFETTIDISYWDDPNLLITLMYPYVLEQFSKMLEFFRWAEIYSCSQKQKAR